MSGSLVTSLDLISAVANYNTFSCTTLFYSINIMYIISIKSKTFSCGTACSKTQAGGATAVFIFPMSRTNVRIDWKLCIHGLCKQGLSFVK